jgi:hypothetical protein
MFTNLFDFSFTRTTKQAIGFYIVWLVMLAIGSSLVSAAASPLLGAKTFKSGFSEGVRIGQSFIIIADTILAFWILKSKNAFSLGNIVLAFLAGGLSILGGGLLGIIPIAYLTTRPNNANRSA